MRPATISVEQYLLGCCLLDNRVARQATSNARREWFFRPAHAIIFDAIQTVVNRGQGVDFVVVKAALGAEGLREAGGEDYLVQLAASIPGVANWQTYLELVEDHYRERELGRIGGIIKELSTDEDRPILDRVAEAASLAAGLLPTDERQESLSQCIKRMAADMDKRIEQGSAQEGLPTGVVDLTRAIGGLEAGRLIIIGARPSVGKSALGLLCAATVAKSKQVLFCSLEMSQEQLVSRLIAMKTGIPTQAQRRVLSVEDRGRYLDGADWANGLKLTIDSRGGLTVPQLRARALALRDEKGLALIVVDYVQLMQPATRTKTGTRQQEIGEITRGLKALALELNVPVVVMAQVGRGAEGGKPSLRDLREAGDIENDADIVILLHRPGDRETWRGDVVAVVEAIIAKHRDGSNGLELIGYRGDRVTFCDIDHDLKRAYEEKRRHEQSEERKRRAA